MNTYMYNSEDMDMYTHHICKVTVLPYVYIHTCRIMLVPLPPLPSDVHVQCIPTYMYFIHTYKNDANIACTRIYNLQEVYVALPPLPPSFSPSILSPSFPPSLFPFHPPALFPSLPSSLPPPPPPPSLTTQTAGLPWSALVCAPVAEPWCVW